MVLRAFMEQLPAMCTEVTMELRTQPRSAKASEWNSDGRSPGEAFISDALVRSTDHHGRAESHPQGPTRACSFIFSAGDRPFGESARAAARRQFLAVNLNCAGLPRPRVKLRHLATTSGPSRRYSTAEMIQDNKRILASCFDRATLPHHSLSGVCLAFVSFHCFF